MKVLIKTINSGQVDVECDDANLTELQLRLKAKKSSWMIFKESAASGGVPVLVNLKNIFTIAVKR